MKKIAFLFATLSLLLLSDNAFATPKSKSQQPNIVFLLADDLGGGDLHCYGHPYSRTPNIDALARDGTRFTQFYAMGATCCPTRTGLMTSKFAATYPVYPANGGFANRVTVAELLKKQGYATGHFGKWHIGPESKPGTYGIDSIGTEEEEGGKKKKKAADDRGRDAHIYDDAIKFIEKNRSGELELYDIIADPAESKNLAKQYPDIVKVLSAKVQAWVAMLPKEYEKSDDKDK